MTIINVYTKGQMTTKSFTKKSEALTYALDMRAMGYKVVNLTAYIREHKQILGDLGVWDKVPANERAMFKASTTDIQVDRYMTQFRHKYM